MEVTQQIMPPLNKVRQPDFGDKLPPGYRFCPTDSELIVSYLKEKIEKGTHPECRLYEVNLYDHKPQDLTAKDEYRGYENETWYFLTPRERKHPNGDRPNRRTKEFGFWKTTQKDKKVFDNARSRHVVGKKRSLAYYEADGTKTEWRMLEYTTIDPNIPKGTNANKLTEWVLCKVYKLKETNQTDSRNQGRQQVQNARNQEHNDQPQDDEPSPRRRRISVDQGSNESNEHQDVLIQDTNHDQVAFVFNPNPQLVQNIDTSGVNLSGGFGHKHGSIVSPNPIMRPIATYDASNFIEPARQEHQGSGTQQVVGSSTCEYYQNLSIPTLTNGFQFSAGASSSYPTLVTSSDLVQQHVNNVNQDTQTTRNVLENGAAPAATDDGMCLTVNWNELLARFNNEDLSSIDSSGYNTLDQIEDRWHRDVVQHVHNVNQDTQTISNMLENDAAPAATEDLNEFLARFDNEDLSSMDSSDHFSLADIDNILNGGTESIFHDTTFLI